ncbi:hypothetical protein H4Q26_000279 [Puccinia striiformis f. sp. tritici PST-130]|nr:hypothetical protein H4Q26_000279 [Puccinia striiformis f. sp. tritici PST-130]
MNMSRRLSEAESKHHTWAHVPAPPHHSIDPRLMAELAQLSGMLWQYDLCALITLRAHPNSVQPSTMDWIMRNRNLRVREMYRADEDSNEEMRADHQIGPITSDDSADPIELTEAVFVAIKSINPIDSLSFTRIYSRISLTAPVLNFLTTFVECPKGIQSATSARLTTKERYKLALRPSCTGISLRLLTPLKPNQDFERHATT